MEAIQTDNGISRLEFKVGRNMQIFAYNGKNYTAYLENHPLDYNGDDKRVRIDQRASLWILEGDQSDLFQSFKDGLGIETDFNLYALVSCTGSANTSSECKNSLFLSYLVESDDSLRKLFFSTLLYIFSNRSEDSSIIAFRIGNFKHFLCDLNEIDPTIHLNNDVVLIPSETKFPQTVLNILDFDV